MRLILCLIFCAIAPGLRADESWESALGRMPVAANVTRLERTNCVAVMLNAFQSNRTVKALIFMPGATDELYMFHRANATLTNSSPTLLDCVAALTNQTLIRAAFRAPFLLLHSDEDPLEPLAETKDQATADKLRQARFVNHVVYNDRDWDSLLFTLQKTYGVWFKPKRHSPSSWHFYRHSFAAWNLSGWEGLQAICLAGKTRFTVEKREVIFEGDERVLVLPTLDQFPR
jgi:hypothetical protein